MINMYIYLLLVSKNNTNILCKFLEGYVKQNILQDDETMLLVM